MERMQSAGRQVHSGNKCRADKILHLRELGIPSWELPAKIRMKKSKLKPKSIAARISFSSLILQLNALIMLQDHGEMVD